MVERMMGVLRLDAHTFEEIERDEGATTQALLVVVLVAVASGIGLLGSDEPGAGLIGGIIASVIGWAVFAAIVAFVGTRLLEASTTSSNWGEVARVLGFAYTPRLLGILAFIPILGWIAAIVGAVWSLIASIVGIRQALDMSTGRAIAVAIVAFLINVVVVGIILAILGVEPAGM